MFLLVFWGLYKKMIPELEKLWFEKQFVIKVPKIWKSGNPAKWKMWQPYKLAKIFSKLKTYWFPKSENSIFKIGNNRYRGGGVHLSR
jgi:hypothetical protein